ncbi:MAG TPA: diguanylate cyclase [Aquabacterium sp.]|uniref:sensor domain-containing diguanylate cyclase n=1 Tax=Aquabacterium sp. TaxID=1872578 RepID=UPI002E37C42A|nr:diguanylate cyclase [Aquabacterium sp.]HEX5372197.1 diguanylate cyclase [Aquabacterium sp.]
MTEAPPTPQTKRSRWAISPTVRISMGLVSLLIGLLMILDLLLKIMPDQRAMTMDLREQIAVHLAVQVRRLLNEDQSPVKLQSVLVETVEQSTDILSLAVRRESGALYAATTLHEKTWDAPPLGASTINAVVVPLNAGDKRWGQLEVGFHSPWPVSIVGWLKNPTVQLVGTLSTACFIAFYLYLRRVLQHLDPSKAIPERVRVAFDTLTEGLLVLDIDGQILMANSAFRGFHPQAGGVLLGRSIDQLEWLVKGLTDQDALPPWERALTTSEPILGVPVDLTEKDGEHRRALLNCAAVRDAAGNARGCLVTLDDITEIDLVNRRLQDAMTELEASRDKIQKQNEELQLLANCDPMTGCFNRRAFFSRAEPMLAHALKTGEPLTCFMTDIDKFKSFNDTYGHSVGDLVIQQVARILKAAMRPQDVLCRYGGEEFCAFMPGLDEAGAAALADRIRETLEKEAGPAVDAVPNLRITSSFGVAQLGKGNANNALLLIERADQGLYAAKEAGRNQVQCIDWHPDKAPAAH